MAVFMKTDDEIVSCPYNKAHLVRKSRLQAHMIKCREVCVEKDKKICPFNATHCIPEAEFQQHLVICEDKAAIDKKVFETIKPSSTYYKGRTAVPSYSAFKISQNEDWDEDNTHDHQALNTREESSPKSESTQFYNGLQEENNSSRSSSEFSNSFEEEDTSYEAQSNVPHNWKAKDFMGMGRGQAILEHLSQSKNQNRIQQPKNQNKISIGRGRGFIINDFICSESSAVLEKENSMKSENMHCFNKPQADDSFDSSSACSSPEDDNRHRSCYKESGDWKPAANVIGIGRGKPPLQCLAQATDPKRAQKYVDQTEIQLSNHQNGFQSNAYQNGASVGRSRGFVSSLRGKKMFVGNSRIVIEKDHLQKRNKVLLSDDEYTQKLKYSIDHLPPCKPGEIRSVPLLCE